MITAKSQPSTGGTRPTVTARTTDSHNITSTTSKLEAGNPAPKKNKEKGLKGKQKEAPKLDSDTNISDDDDSQEREAALSSPIKGKISRQLNKVN